MFCRQARELELRIEESLAALEREPAVLLEDLAEPARGEPLRGRASELAALHLATDRLEAAIARLGAADPDAQETATEEEE